MDPDRLEEEKRRGMTIDLGFAWLTLPSGTDVSIVDVPGHERFIKNMLAGAAGVDVALLVVAADEGVMPQTREHLDILDLLEIRQGVVALTKSDLVDEEWRMLVEDDVRNVLSNSLLRSAPIVPVSVVSGEGLDHLLAALDQAVAAAPTRRDSGVPYLPVDRVFTSRGFGTVVTGTLHGGTLRQGEEVEIVPTGRRARIRNVQTHRTHTDEAEAGARVALNLGGASRDDVRRGDVAARPGTVRAVRRFDALVRVLPDAALPLAHASRVMLHLGAAERSATLSMLDHEELPSGSTGWVRMRLDDDVAAVRGQHFVLRMPAPGRTVAGGIVADVAPRQRRGAPTRLAALLSDDLGAATVAAFSGRRPQRISDLAVELGVAPSHIDAVLATLQRRGDVISVGDAYVSAPEWAELRARALSALSNFHREQPLRRGMPKEELGRKVGWSGNEWSAAVEALAREGAVTSHASLVAVPSHRGGVSDRREEADRVLNVLRRDPFSPPGEADLRAEAKTDASFLAALAAEGEIVDVGSGLYFAREAYVKVCRQVIECVRADGEVTVARVRDVLGTSRKYALALLEHMDAERVTQRRGDARVLGSKAGACA